MRNYALGLPRLSRRDVEGLRPSIERPSPGDAPLGIEEELEPDGHGQTVRVVTVFLRGSECTFRCTMCDLWRYTHPEPTAPGRIASQVAKAVDHIQRQCLASDGPEIRPNDYGDDSGQVADSSVPTSAPVRWIKLYNAANFFVPRNVPTEDLPQIARHVRSFERVIVENHPRLCVPAVERFRSDLAGRLEVAMGLETVHPELLAWLNKQCTVEDFATACRWLQERQIDVRAFVLLQLPGLSEQESIRWCRRSIAFARDVGCRHVSIIPLRTGNGALDLLQQQELLSTPTVDSVEAVLAEELGGGTVVTADLWDFDRLHGGCDECREQRRARLQQMNLKQRVEPEIRCRRCSARS